MDPPKTWQDGSSVDHSLALLQTPPIMRYTPVHYILQLAPPEQR